MKVFKSKSNAQRWIDRNAAGAVTVFLSGKRGYPDEFTGAPKKARDGKS